MIPLKDQEAIRTRLDAHLGGTVHIDHFTETDSKLVVPGHEPCVSCTDARTVMQELAGLSGRLNLTVYNLPEAEAEARRLGVQHIPATIIRGPNNRAFRFYGLPLGTLFPGFIEALIAASNGSFTEETNGMELDPEQRRRLKRIKDDVTLRLYLSLTCSFSLAMAMVAFAFAIENHHVKVEMFEVLEFPSLAARLNLEAAPTTVINDQIVLIGGVSTSKLLDHMLTAIRSKGAAASVERSKHLTMLPPPSGAKPEPKPRGERRTPGGIILS